MVISLLVAFFILGTLIGSFLNVVVLRYGTRRLSGRSLCFSCGKKLRWFELIPLLSFALQRARCRSCKSRIAWQYPLVELATGLVFAVIFFTQFPFLFSSSFSIFHISYFIFHLLLWSLLIALSVYDLKHKIIPNALVYSASLCALSLFLISYFIRQPADHISSPLDFWSGFALFALFALLFLFSKGRAIGLGDAKLMLFFPWVLGVSKGLSAVIVGFWIGAALSLFALLLKALVARFPPRRVSALRATLAPLHMKTELPLGPFLVLGLFLVYVFRWDVVGLSFLLR
ncbi:MAG: hypothetical protein A2849_02470 [Candidatus Taylorbacteria bacterium RIFCSPHIGHO2_01_FULL_51_15]|uniref:Peptidase A24A N-terminal domain-containing protein n=1 Tax=Candidatus Taylorbacteria bacterium RIFCSPHIGHO2_01_FULL_51_15 TaxID=1802304 RepID=A0A1G2MA69_9BACT|nr:MAG: hypothetical protein A2849_02470 [Candidatus Taylorbacteria bacterium RIFCSPHIGHO2_01_FULL_51_15]